jgi:hypothetical protein
MGLLGATSFGKLDKSYLHPASPVVPASVHSAFLPLLRLPEEGY